MYNVGLELNRKHFSLQMNPPVPGLPGRCTIGLPGLVGVTTGVIHMLPKHFCPTAHWASVTQRAAAGSTDWAHLIWQSGRKNFSGSCL